MSSGQQVLLMANDGGEGPYFCAGDPYFSCVDTGSAPRTVLTVHADAAPLEDTSCYRTKTVTLTGVAEVQTSVVKFGAGAVAVPNTGSSSINGIEVVDDTDFDFGVADFTLCFWAYRTANTFAGYLFDLGTTTVRSTAIVGTDGLVDLVLRSSGGTTTANNVASFTAGQWNFVVLQRALDSWQLYINGDIVYSNQVGPSSPATDTINSSANWFFGRAATSTAQTLNGFLDEVSLARGVARYPSISIAPQTAAYPNSLAEDPSYNSISLLLHFDGANGSTSIVDNGPLGIGVTAFNGAAISTSQSKFGGASLLLDGSNDYCLFNTFSGIEFGTQPFTIEVWVRPDTINSPFSTVISTLRASSGSPANRGWRVLIAPSGAILFNAYSDQTWGIVNSAGNNLYTRDGLVSTGTWTHIVVCSTGTAIGIFCNGTLAAISAIRGGTAGILAPGFATCDIGKTESNFWYFDGFIDDLRVTKGVARYSLSFVPPAQPFCDSTVSFVTNGTEPLDGQSVATAQGAMRVLNPWVKLVGSAVASAAGTITAVQPNIAVALTGISVGTTQAAFSVETSNRTAALSGQSAAVARGALAVAPYPNLISSITTLTTTLSSPATTITVGTDGVVSFARDAAFTETTNWMIATSAFTPAQVSDKYQVVSVTVFSGSFATLPALPFVLSSSFAAITNGAAEIQVNVAPVATNPRYGEAGYFSTIRVSIPPSDMT